MTAKNATGRFLKRSSEWVNKWLIEQRSLRERARKLPEFRSVRVVFGIAGLGMITEEYDRLNLSDQLCWEANSRAPNCQLSIEPFGKLIKSDAERSALAFIGDIVRHEAPRLAKS